MAPQFLELVAACVEENEYTVWQEMDSGIGTLMNVLSRTVEETVAKFDTFVRKVYGTICEKVTWNTIEGESQFFGAFLACCSTTGRPWVLIWVCHPWVRQTCMAGKKTRVVVGLFLAEK